MRPWDVLSGGSSLVRGTAPASGAPGLASVGAQAGAGRAGARPAPPHHGSAARCGARGAIRRRQSAVSQSAVPQCAAVNCSLSVDPLSAVVDACGVIAEVTRSKYPVPTSRWCRVAV
jgi:hypothetical protein